MMKTKLISKIWNNSLSLNKFKPKLQHIRSKNFGWKDEETNKNDFHLKIFTIFTILLQIFTSLQFHLKIHYHQIQI